MTHTRLLSSALTLVWMASACTTGGSSTSTSTSSSGGAASSNGGTSSNGGVSSGGGSSSSGAPPDCIQIDRAAVAGIVPPSGLQVQFRVLDCNGAAVRQLRTEVDDQDVVVINDETGISFNQSSEGDSEAYLGLPSAIELYSVLVLDLSDSIYENGVKDAVIDGALAFVNQVVTLPEPRLRHHVAIIAFGSTANTTVVQDFTQDPVTLQAALETLRQEPSRGTTNLYGAYIEALDMVAEEGSTGAVVERFVVVMTDGTHEAGNTEALRQQALNRKHQVGATVYSIGVQGDYDACRLEELAGSSVTGGTGGCREGDACQPGTTPPASCTQYLNVETSAQLAAAFQNVAQRADGIARSNYVVGICTPVELGNPTLTVRVNVDSATAEATLPYSTDTLTGQLASCDAIGIAEGILECTDNENCVVRCLNMECGSDNGVSCGTCAGLSYCDAQQRCQPACMGMECGTDQGVACGTCPANEFCGTDNLCAPTCANMDCGMDQGVACGTCTDPQVCGADNRCRTPCEGLQCGNDPVTGESCGTCASPTYCGEDQQCVTPCNGLACGFDHGVSCGSCGDGEYCNDHTCVAACDPNPCQNGGTCSASLTGYQCTCPAGFDGLNCAHPVRFCNASYTVNTPSDLTPIMGCTTITGNLTLAFASADGADLTGMESLTRVGGTLIIGLTSGASGSARSRLASIQGLEGLRQVNALQIRRSIITDVDALRNLTEVTTTVTVEQNGSLHDLRGFNGLTTVSSVVIRFSGRGNSYGFSNLTQSDVSITGFGADPPAPFSGFESLTTTPRIDVDLSNFSRVSLPSLTSVTGEVSISSQRPPTDISFPVLATVGGRLSVSAYSLGTYPPGSVHLPALTSVAADQTSGGECLNVGDGVREFDAPLLASIGGTSAQTDCLMVDGVSLTALNLPALIHVGGSVRIAGEVLGAVDLPLLASVAPPTNGSGVEGVQISSAPVLTSLNLPALTDVDGVWIQDTPTLQTVHLEALAAANTLHIDGASALTGVPAMPNLTVLDSLRLFDNFSLTSLDGLAALTTVSSLLAIRNNPSLAQCEVTALSTRVNRACTSCTGNNTAATCP